MQSQSLVPVNKDSEDGKNTNQNSCSCDHEEERRLWYQWYQDYVSASEERYKKKIQSLRSSCRQQVRNLVVKLHKEYEDKVKKLREDSEKTLDAQKDKFLKKIKQLERSVRLAENNLKTFQRIEDIVLSDSDSAETNDNSKDHEKCQNSYQKLESLLESKEEELSQITQELGEANLLLSVKQEMNEDLDSLDKQVFQEKEKELKTTSIQTDVLHHQLHDISKTSKMLQKISKTSKRAKLKIENLGVLSIPEDSKQDSMVEKLKRNKTNFQATLASKENALKELQEKIDKLEAELEKSNKVNEDLHERVKLLQKSFNPEQRPKKSRESNRSSFENKKIWQKKIMILQESLHAIRNEMYLRQNLEKQATMLHRAGISYAVRPETPEGVPPFQAKLMPSDQNLDEELPAKGNTMLPAIQDINHELSALLAANGWWKQ